MMNFKAAEGQLMCLSYLRLRLLLSDEYKIFPSMPSK